jgi:hypothetical protein
MKACTAWEVSTKTELAKFLPLEKPAKFHFRGCCFSRGDSGNIITFQGKPRFRSVFTLWHLQSKKALKTSAPSYKTLHTAFASSQLDKSHYIASAFGVCIFF